MKYLFLILFLSSCGQRELISYDLYDGSCSVIFTDLASHIPFVEVDGTKVSAASLCNKHSDISLNKYSSEHCYKTSITTSSIYFTCQRL